MTALPHTPCSITQIFPLPAPGAARPGPRLVTLFFGANDAALPDRCAARQHLPLDEYQRNLGAMAEHLRAVGTQHIVLVTPPPVHEASRITFMQQRDGVSDATSQAERTNRTAGAPLLPYRSFQ